MPSGMPHEICIRTKAGLPFPCWLLIRLLLASAMARAARASRVTICHFIWMANHLHLLVVVQDANDCKNFYGELQKNLTDYVKRLCGLSHLGLWDGRPMVAPILDSAKVKERIAYFYCNPARANLVESISEYPGFSSWDTFSEAGASLESNSSEIVPWVHCPSIKKLPADKIPISVDRSLTAELKASCTEHEELVIKPNAWASCFKLNESDVEKANKSIKSIVVYKEKWFSVARKKEGKRVIGAQALRCQQFQKAHSPRKKERKIFVLSSSAELRTQFIDMLNALCDRCVELYQKGCFYIWPPGMFRPPAPPLASALGWRSF